MMKHGEIYHWYLQRKDRYINLQDCGIFYFLRKSTFEASVSKILILKIYRDDIAGSGHVALHSMHDMHERINGWHEMTDRLVG